MKASASGNLGMEHTGGRLLQGPFPLLSFILKWWSLFLLRDFEKMMVVVRNDYVRIRSFSIALAGVGNYTDIKTPERIPPRDAARLDCPAMLWIVDLHCRRVSWFSLRF